jgi:hypothetical protein
MLFLLLTVFSIALIFGSVPAYLIESDAGQRILVAAL